MTTLADKATVSADFTTRDYRAVGVKVPPVMVFKAFDTAALDARGRLRAFSGAVTNLLPDLTGATLGVIGSGGALPAGWVSGTLGVPKQITKASPTAMTTRFGPATTSDFGTLRTGLLTPGADVAVICDIEVTNTAVTDRVEVFVSWFLDAGGVFSESLDCYRSGGPTHVIARLPNPGAARRIAFAVRASDGQPLTGLLPDVQISNLMVIPATSGTSPVGLPTRTITAPSVFTTVLNAPDGPYVLIADTVEAGTVRVNTTAAAGAGVNVGAALGGFYTVRALHLVPVAAYNPADLDTIAGATFHSAMRPDGAQDPVAGALGMRKLPTGVVFDVMGANLSRSVQVATNRPGLTRFDVNAGDVKPGDSASQERAELIDYTSFPFDTDLWTSDHFRVVEYPYETGLKYSIIHQWRTNGPSGRGPEISLAIYPVDDTHVSVTFVTRGDADPAGTVNPPTLTPETNITTPASVTRWRQTVAVGSWNRLVSRVQFSKSGGGFLQLWFNGVEVFNLAVPVGYNQDTGAQFHFGVYRNAHTARHLVEHTNVEYGTASLLARVTAPLPL